MNLSKVWLIISREYIYNFTRKSFLFSAFGVPLIIGVSTFAVIELISNTENSLDDFTAIGYVDQAGILNSQPDEEFTAFTAYPDTEFARLAFDDNTIQAYFVLPEDYLSSGNVSYFGDKQLNDALKEKFQDFLLVNITALAPNSRSSERLRDPVNLGIHLLGEADTLSEEAAILRFALPMVFGFLFVINVITASQFLMSGVVEEKENHIMEILLTSCRPLEMITGKVIGLGALAITQMLFWSLMGLVIGGATGRLDTLQNARFEPGLIGIMILYFLLSFLMFAGVMVGIGAAVSAEQESRQIASIFTLIAILPPSWGFALFISSPDSPIVTFLSLFPLTSPVAMMILLGLGEADMWQIALSLLILCLTIIFVLWAAARIFRTGMLISGQRLSLKQLRYMLKG